MKRNQTVKRNQTGKKLLPVLTIVGVCAVGAFVWAEQQPETQEVARNPTPQIAQQDLGLDLTRYRWDGAAEIAWLDIEPDKKSVDSTPVLGIHVRSADATLRHHLGLADGVGLVVQFVTPEGAAADAGILKHDVLEKLDDQILVNDQQLLTLIQMHKPGDQVRLTLIRGGKTIDRSATLESGSGQSAVELYPKDMPLQDMTSHFAKIHDMTNPSMLNCAACHVMSGYYGAAVSN